MNMNQDKIIINESKPFDKQVDDVLSGADTTSSHLEVLKVTPPLLRMVGVPNLPILMTAHHVKTITQENGSDSANYHGLGADIVKRLPELISDPVMIMDSLTKDDSIVVVTQTVDKENRPLIGAIKIAGKAYENSRRIEANILTSAYGKDNFSSFIRRNVEAGAVLYIDKEKSQELCNVPGIQFPDKIDSLDFDTIIRKTNAFVNMKEEKNQKTSEKSGKNMKADANNATAQSVRERVQQVRDDMVKTLLEHIEKNPTDWQSGWNNIAAGAPYNGKTNTAYRGINALYLAFLGASRGYKDTRWVTFNQAKELGASVKKGEKSSPVIFFEFYDRATKKAFDSRTVKDMTDEEKAAYLKENVYAVMKYSSVFNAEQCHNFPERKEIAMSEEERANLNAKIETIISNSGAPVLYDGGSQAYYLPGTDEIHLPEIKAFDTMQDYYATALHEIAHSTGHESRLNRDLSGGFGSESYAKEELRAELACVFMQMEQGIQLNGKHITNHAAYLNSWLEAAKRDTSVFFKAAADAQKIADYVAENYLQAADVAVAADENVVKEQRERNPMAEYVNAEQLKRDTKTETAFLGETSEQKLQNARALAQRLAAETGEPHVTIEWSEHQALNSYDVIPLSEADKKLAALDAQADKEEGYYKTKLHIDYVFEDRHNAYDCCRFDIGSEGGGLVHHIDEFLKNDTFLDDEERVEGEAALEYFKQHMAISEYLASPEKLAELTDAEQEDINVYVNKGRTVLNTTQPFSEYYSHMPLRPEVLKQARDAAHAAGLPFYEGTREEWDAFEESGGYVYDGNMSVEDYQKMWELREREETDTRLSVEPFLNETKYGSPISGIIETQRGHHIAIINNNQQKEPGYPDGYPAGYIIAHDYNPGTGEFITATQGFASHEEAREYLSKEYGFDIGQSHEKGVNKAKNAIERRLRAYADILRRNDLEIGNTAQTEEYYLNQAREQIAAYERSDEYRQAASEAFPKDFDANDGFTDALLDGLKNGEREKKSTVEEARSINLSAEEFAGLQRGFEILDNVKTYEKFSEATLEMVRKYGQVKRENPAEIVFYRIDDFYEVLGEDAKRAAQELGLTLTGRDAGLTERIPMAGVPYHAIDEYTAKLAEKGVDIAVADDDSIKHIKGHSMRNAPQTAQNEPLQANSVKREWLTIDLQDGAVGGKYGENTMIKMPKGEFSYYVFYVSSKMLKETDGKTQLRVASDYRFRLNNDGRQVELTGQELKDSFTGKNIDKTYKRVAPSRKYAQVLDNLEKNVPSELKAIPTWCCYRTHWNDERGKKDKFIISPIDGKWASSKELNRWVTFEKAIKYARENNCEGVALLLDKQYGITCIDLDKCVVNADTFEMKERATKLVEGLKGTYMERSTSNNGIHIFLKDDILKNGKYRNTAVDEKKGDLEVFDDKRIISITGNMFSESNKLTRAGSAVTLYLRQQLGERKKFYNETVHNSVNSLNLTDRDLIEWIRRSKKGGEFNDLYNGKAVTGDKSVDDAKLAHLLLYFSNGDREQTFRIMRESGLNRQEKPDSYYRTTINAIDSKMQSYAKRPTLAADGTKKSGKVSGRGGKV